MVLSESRIAFCWLFIVRVKKVCYERTVWEELLRCFYHCTMKWLPPWVDMFLLQALGWWRYRTAKSVSAKMKHSAQLIQKHNKNDIFNSVPCQVRLILSNTNLSTKNNISLMKTVLKMLSKMLSITTNLVKSRYKHKKDFG